MPVTPENTMTSNKSTSSCNKKRKMTTNTVQNCSIRAMETTTTLWNCNNDHDIISGGDNDGVSCRPSFLTTFRENLTTVLFSILPLLLLVVIQCTGPTDVEQLLVHDPYAVLGIQPHQREDKKAIRKAFRALSLKYWRYERFESPSDEKNFILCSKAYEILTDDETRDNWERCGDVDCTAIGIQGCEVFKKIRVVYWLLVSFSVCIVVCTITRCLVLRRRRGRSTSTRTARTRTPAAEYQCPVTWDEKLDKERSNNTTKPNDDHASWVFVERDHTRRVEQATVIPKQIQKE